MRLDANKGNYNLWCVYHAEKCCVLRKVMWVDDETAQWCEGLAVVNGTLMTRVKQAKKIAIIVERRLVVINPVDDARDETIAVKKLANEQESCGVSDV